MIEEKGWSIFNENMSGDKKGEFTFTGSKGCTVIDYLIGDSSPHISPHILRCEREN